MNGSKQSGFSVLEALLAVAIIALTLLPIIDLQIQVTRSHGRQIALREQLTAQRNGLVVLREINPMATPTGRLNLAPDLEMRWIAHPRTPAVRSLDFLGGDGGYRVALYAVDAQVVAADGRRVASFTVDQVGWRSLLPAE